MGVGTYTETSSVYCILLSKHPWVLETHWGWVLYTERPFVRTLYNVYAAVHKKKGWVFTRRWVLTREITV